MSAEQLLYAIGDIHGALIREAAPQSAPPRRGKRRWAILAAACLCLVVLIARVRPAAPGPGGDTAPGAVPPAGSDAPAGPSAPSGEDIPAGCDLLPGKIAQPLLYWQGTAYAWASVGAPGQPVGEPPETIDQWTELGPLAGVTAEETAEDLWLYADIGQVSGTVYADPEEHPGVLYVLMTTEWFEEEWVRFVSDERLLEPVFFYGGALRYLPPSYPTRSVVAELPEGYEPVGRLFYTADFDRLPDQELAISLCSEYPGSMLYVHPERTDILYVERQNVWRGGSWTDYVPAALTPQPWE